MLPVNYVCKECGKQGTVFVRGRMPEEDEEEWACKTIRRQVLESHGLQSLFCENEHIDFCLLQDKRSEYVGHDFVEEEQLEKVNAAGKK